MKKKNESRGKHGERKSHEETNKKKGAKEKKIVEKYSRRIERKRGEYQRRKY